MATTSAAAEAPVRTRRIPWTRYALVAALLVVGVAFPLVVDTFWLSTATFVLIAAIGALGLNVLTGYTGQVSLGHAFFLGAGAYTVAGIGGSHHLWGLLWVLPAGIVAAVCGALIGPTALRLRGLYLAIVTIGLVFIGQHIFVSTTSLSGGSQGRLIPPMFGPDEYGYTTDSPTSVLGISLERNGLYYYTAFVLLALSMWFVHNMTNARAGRAMQAVRDREVAASLLGVDVARSKLAAFVVSSFLAGVSGALYGAYLIHVDPDVWGLILSIQYVAMIIVGGIGTVWGGVLGAAFVVGLPQILNHWSDYFPFLQHGAGGNGISVGDASNILYGVLIIVFLVLEPRGLVGLVARVRSLLARRTAPQPATP